jgi:hypothetical protein
MVLRALIRRVDGLYEYLNKYENKVKIKVTLQPTVSQ